MPRTCFVPGCGANGVKGSKYVPIFSFPRANSDAERRATWLKAINNPLEPSQISCVCIKHFEPHFVNYEEKTTTKDGKPLAEPRHRYVLTHDAIPTIFNRSKQEAALKLRQEKRQKNSVKPRPKESPRLKELHMQYQKERKVRIEVSKDFLGEFGPQFYTPLDPWKGEYEILESREDGEKNPLFWTKNEVSDFIDLLTGNSDLGKVFRAQEVDGGAFLDITLKDLLDLFNIKYGPALKISNSIKELRVRVCEAFIGKKPLEEIKENGKH